MSDELLSTSLVSLSNMAPTAVSSERASADGAGGLTTAFDDTLRFYLNGTKVVLDDIDPEATLLEYLRGIGLTGTKLYAQPTLSRRSMRRVAWHR